jgi:cell division septation protein DedD
VPVVALALSGLMGTAAVPAHAVQVQTGQPPAVPDSLYRRAQRMVADGDAVRGRALLDSLVRATRDGTPERANALFWRATLAADTPSAQRDYLIIAIDYALTPRAADALLRLAQIDLTGGNRSSAHQRLERLVLEHPTTPAATEGWFFLGGARRDEGDLAGGCAALDSVRARLAPTDVERRNQVDFQSRPCRDLVNTPPPSGGAAPPPGLTPPRTNTGPPQAAPDSVRTPPPDQPQWSVQVAALRTQREGDSLVEQLRGRGHTARIAHIPPYYRVRVGFFKTRQEASALAATLKRQGFDAIVVEAERREP